jgi:hypothetical protein
MNNFVVDRIQTGGPGQLNIPQERIYELGNFQSVGIVRDVPDLSFSLDCLDVSTEVEGILVGATAPETDPLDSTSYDLSLNKVVDIISPFKTDVGVFTTVRGVAIPHLQLESVSYKYGLKQNAGETFSLKGDSIFYVPGTPYTQVFTGNGSTTSFSFTNTALLYTEQGNSRYALNVSVDGVRQLHNVDFTDTSTGITFAVAPLAAAKIRVVYGSATAATYAQSANADLTVKPAAIRGKDIQVYVGKTVAATPVPILWTDIQSVNIDWKTTLDETFEFGNAYAVSREALTAPDVTGSIELKPQTAASLFTKLNQMTGINSANIVGPDSSVTLPIQVRLLNPASGGTTAVPVGTVLKTLYIPDARFTIPGFSGQSSQSLVQTLEFQGDSGAFKVFKGLPFGV